MGVIAAMVPLMVRSVATRGRVLAMAALGLVGIGLGVVLRLVENDGAINTLEVVPEVGLRLLLPVIALVVASAVFGTLIEKRTLVYLWLRPIGRWQIAAAAMVAALLIVVPLVVTPIAIIAGLVGEEVGTGTAAVAAAIAAVLGAIAYVGAFTCLGLFTERALAWGLVYIVVWEGFIASISRGAGRLAMTTWTTSLMSRLADAPGLIDDPYTVVTAALVLASVGLAAFGVSVWRLNRMDIA